MILQLSFDDGLKEDSVIIDSLNKYNLLKYSVFYIPVQSYGYQNSYMYQGINIGGHTISHPSDLKLLSTNSKVFEIRDCKSLLEEKFCREVTSFCYPRGRYDDECVQIVKDTGYSDARTTVVNATSYDDAYRKPTSFHVFRRKEYPQNTSLYNHFCGLLEQAKKNGYLHIWGHSKEIIDNNLLTIFELICLKLKQNEHIYS